MIADAPEHRNRVFAGVEFFQTVDHLVGRLARVGVVALIAAAHHHLGAVVADPHEVLRRQRHVVMAGTGDEVGIVAAFAEDLDQPAAVTEGVEADSGGGALAEFFFKIGAAGHDLPDKAFP